MAVYSLTHSLVRSLSSSLTGGDDDLVAPAGFGFVVQNGQPVTYNNNYILMRM